MQTLELADRDDRLLLDIGLVRAEDGSLRLAEDPSHIAVPPLAIAGLPRTGFWSGLAGLFRWLRSLPWRSPDWRPHFFLRE